MTALADAGKSSDSEQRSAASADDIAHELRVRIQNRELEPGEWLREARLCTEYGVGRSIVRRALRTLAADGLIELEENRGARISATTVEEVFDLYETRAALYGLAARFACLRGSAAKIAHMLALIDQLLEEAGHGAAPAQIIDTSEAIFSEMAESASPDAQKMIESIRRKTRFHYSYVALALAESGGPYDYWRQVRAALVARDADKASEAARKILYYMQKEVARIMLAHGSRMQDVRPSRAGASTETRA
jgi:DNA-binding GntR family transcriptional regulator